jgi:hypothetical protein
VCRLGKTLVVIGLTEDVVERRCGEMLNWVVVLGSCFFLLFVYHSVDQTC